MAKNGELIAAILIVLATASLGITHGVILTLEKQPTETYTIVTSFFRDLIAGVFYFAVLTLGSIVLLPGLLFFYLASTTLGTMTVFAAQIPTLRLLLFTSYYLLMLVACTAGVREALLFFRRGSINLGRILSVYIVLYLVYTSFLVVEYYASYFLTLF